MEPPTDIHSPAGHSHRWNDSPPRYPPHRRQRKNQYDQEQQQYHQQQEHYDSREQSSSRGRSSIRHPFNNSVQHTSDGGNGGGQQHRMTSASSGSSTPLRKGNPQSSSPSLDGSRQRPQQQLQLPPAAPPSPDSSASLGSKPALNPLSTLTAILTSHTDHASTTLQLYRQSHALHRQASDRTTVALDKLRLAQAEVEHATTAQEYAKEELERAASQRTEAQDALNGICKRVKILSRSIVNRRVTLVGLSKSAQWNGRRGTIVKLVTGGEDVGRWKVRLDPDWRGKDAEGRRAKRHDAIRDGDDSEEQEGASQNVVVAKAENLNLVKEESDEGMRMLFGQHGNAVNNMPQQQRSASRSRLASSHRLVHHHDQEGQTHEDIHPAKSRDPEQEEYENYHHNLKQQPHRHQRDPSILSNRREAPVLVTPENRASNRGPQKNISPVSYYKSESGQYHESPQRRSRSGQHPQHNSQHQDLKNMGPSGQRSQPRNASRNGDEPNPPKCPSPSKTSPFKLNPPRNSPSQSSNSKLRGIHNNNGNDKHAPHPIHRSPSNDSTRLSSAFSRMLLSPVSFAPVNFNPDQGDGFGRRALSQDSQKRHGSRGLHGGNIRHDQLNGEQGRKPHHTSPGDTVSIAGSFFDEVTLLEKNDAPFSYNGDNDQGTVNDRFFQQEKIQRVHHGNGNSSAHGETSSDPQLQPYPSQEVSQSGEEYVNEDGNHEAEDGLPTIVVLPVPEDDYGNPFLSPGYSSSSPPHCVGVQNAGVSQVNGVYLLAYPKDEHGEVIVDDDDEGGTGTPPLYFRDGPPILLSDNRYYDMCILRINCPDSSDHVIWFLARVDVDPNCLDVKFSDCYYYCRMLRNDDGQGGEREGGCQSPPRRGWNVPKLPPGVEMLRIAPSGSFSTAEDNHNLNGQHHHGGGLGIGPRPSGSEEEDCDEEEMHFISSPGVDSGFGSKMSNYSI